MRFPNKWNGKLVITGAPGIRKQYSVDPVISDFVLARGYAYASTDKGNDGVDFYTLGRDEGQDDVPTADGIRHVEFVVRSDVQPPVLVRRVTRNLMPTTNPPVEEEIICRDVKSFSVRYFDGLTWQETWDSTAVGDVLPMMISVTLELNDPDAPAGAVASSHKATRVISMSCGKPVDTLTSGG